MKLIKKIIKKLNIFDFNVGDLELKQKDLHTPRDKKMLKWFNKD